MNGNWILTKLYDTEDNVFGITVDNNGNIYYTTNGSNVFLLSKDNIDPEPQILVKIKGRLRGIVWNGDNILYICDCNNHSILSYSIDTRNLSTLTGNGKDGHNDGNIKEAEFCAPQGISVDKNGDLYITEFFYVRKIHLSKGTVETIAGSYPYGYNDGEARSAKFCMCSGIAVSSDDTIYVVDHRNHCIRKIKNGVVSTIAGTPHKRGHQDGSPSESQFHHPRGILFDVDGSILIADENGLRRVDMNQNVVSTLGKKIDSESRPRSLAKDKEGNIYVGTIDSIIKLENTWKWKRFLWIGWMKENSKDCLLATLPKEIIQVIAVHLIQAKEKQ